MLTKRELQECGGESLSSHHLVESARSAWVTWWDLSYTVRPVCYSRLTSVHHSVTKPSVKMDVCAHRAASAKTWLIMTEPLIHNHSGQWHACSLSYSKKAWRTATAQVRDNNEQCLSIGLSICLSASLLSLLHPSPWSPSWAWPYNTSAQLPKCWATSFKSKSQAGSGGAGL